MIILYLTLENYVPEDVILPEGCIRSGTSVYLKNIKPGIYGDIEVRRYARICGDTSIYPEAKHLGNAIGRYNVGNMTFDIVFSCNNKDEYLKCNYGFWNGWIYSLQNANLATLTMYYINKLPPEDRIPYKVVKYITSIADQSNDENGILHGRWDGKYDDATHPISWKSVGEIVNQRIETGKPVKYGQCWVFSEVLTAIFRFLGIPARTVFSQNAHVDVGKDRGIDFLNVVLKGEITEYRIRTIDFINNEIEGDLCPEDVFKGDADEEDITNLVKKGDRYWNFHLWCEVWCERPDLLPPYDNEDWQVCDPSPVMDIKNNDGKSFFGPCPVTSIRDGVTQKYDHNYIFSTVNSIPRYWNYFDYGGTTIIYPYDIKYLILDPTSLELRKVHLFTRDLEKSNKLEVAKSVITANYRFPSLKFALNAYHKEFPIIIYHDNESIKVQIRRHSRARYMVQICYLNKHKLISCHRKIYSNLNDIDFPDKPEGINRISLLTINLDTREFWPQVLS